MYIKLIKEETLGSTCFKGLRSKPPTFNPSAHSKFPPFSTLTLSPPRSVDFSNMTSNNEEEEAKLILLSIYYVPDTVLSILRIFFFFFFLSSQHYYSHLTDEETEVQRGRLTWPRPPSQ